MFEEEILGIFGADNAPYIEYTENGGFLVIPSNSSCLKIREIRQNLENLKKRQITSDQYNSLSLWINEGELNEVKNLPGNLTQSLKNIESAFLATKTPLNVCEDIAGERELNQGCELTLIFVESLNKCPYSEEEGFFLGLRNMILEVWNPKVVKAKIKELEEKLKESPEEEESDIQIPLDLLKDSHFRKKLRELFGTSSCQSCSSQS